MLRRVPTSTLRPVRLRSNHARRHINSPLALLAIAMIVGIAIGAAGCGLVPGSGGSSAGKGNPGGETASSPLTPSSTSLSFGNLPVGNSATQGVILTDVGTTNITISEVAASGSGFSASGGSNVTLTPNQSIAINVNFNPKATGSAKGTLSVSSDASNSSLNLSLSGAGMPKNSESSQLTASSTSLNFGSLTVGTSSSQLVTFVDVGTANITISAVATTGSGFKANGGLNVTLVPKQSATVNVTFDPSGPGAAQGNLSISSDASNSLVQLGLSGTGVAPVVAHKVALNWQPSVSAVIGYFVYRGPAPNSLSRLTGSVDPSPSYTDTNVAGGQTYVYAVTSVDSSNIESAPSSPVSVTIPNQ
jgi:hypothetical protein